ncbi:MAG TPA: low temperature requirement protein A [Pseudolysinimonas sp.]|nr:low temperature requirement protein A [Pseudolysinimonas sp.]
MPAHLRQLHVRMRGRSTEGHRASTPLELLFDLTFVVAIASLTVELAHGLVTGHPGAIPAFLMVFAAVWWAWINFTWFASAFDVDDALYRVLTLVQMAGVLVLAAGVPTGFEHNDFRAITVGYVIMRVAILGQWLRAGIEHPQNRQAAFKYAGGIFVVQLLWVLRLLLLPPALFTPTFLVLIVAEMSIPVWAEWRNRTTWHPGHIAERYALFVIILLGEVVAAATGAMQVALAKSGLTPLLVTIGLSGLVLLFSIWWLYFLEPAEAGLRRRRSWSYFWGYGHYLLFAAIAAIGAGLELAVDVAGHEPRIGSVAVGYSLAVPVAVVFVMLYALHRPFRQPDEVPGRVLIPAAVLTMLIPLAAPAFGVGATVAGVALIGAAVVVATIVVALRRRPAPRD